MRLRRRDYGISFLAAAVLLAVFVMDPVGEALIGILFYSLILSFVTGTVTNLLLPTKTKP